VPFGSTQFGQHRRWITSSLYEGRLSDSGLPANGQYSMNFNLHASANPGPALFTYIPPQPVNVVSGLFSVVLDFPAGLFDGNDRWLEIFVAPPGSQVFHPAKSISKDQGRTLRLYADHAGTTLRALEADGVRESGVVTEAIAPGAVTPDKISPGQRRQEPEWTDGFRDTGTRPQCHHYTQWQHADHRRRRRQ
jgi:hypothetical protein